MLIKVKEINMTKHLEGRSPFAFFVLTIALTLLIWLPSIMTGLIVAYLI